WRRTSPSGATALVLAACVATFVDFVPAARGTTSLEVPDVYRALEALPPGPVLQIPFGVRDGFGEHGSFDDRVLFYQTVHGHAQMGGFVARLSPRTQTDIESDSVLGPLLTLSEGRQPAVDAAPRCRSARSCAVRYVLIDTAAASRDLQAFVQQAFVLTPAAI